MINCLGKVYVLRFLSDRRLAKTRDPDKVEETEAAISPASATQPSPPPARPRAPAPTQRGQGHRGRLLPRRVHRAHPAAHPPALARPRAPGLGQRRHHKHHELSLSTMLSPHSQNGQKVLPLAFPRRFLGYFYVSLKTEKIMQH